MNENATVNNLPAKIDYLPNETRLLAVLSELPHIVAAIEQQNTRENNMRRLQDAMLHVTPIELHALVINDRTKVMLEPRVKILVNSAVTENDKIEDLALETKDGDVENKESIVLSIKQLARRLVVVLHDDTCDPIIESLFAKDERTELFTQVIQAVDSYNLKVLQQLFTRIIPRYYQEVTKYYQKKGLSLQQIFEIYPQLITDLELAKYLTHIQTSNDNKWSGILENNKVVDQTVDKIVARKIIWSRGNSFLSLTQCANRIATYMEENVSDNIILDCMHNICSTMRKIGFIFGYNALYEELRELPPTTQLSNIEALIDDTLSSLILDFFDLIKTVKFFPNNIEQLVAKLKAKIDIMYSYAQQYQRELRTSPIDTEREQVTRQLLSRVKDVLAGDEEKVLPNGVKLRIIKNPMGTIWDTHIQWLEYSSDHPDSTTCRQYDCVLIEGKWWFRYSISNTWTTQGTTLAGLSLRWSNFDNRQMDSLSYLFPERKVLLRDHESVLERKARQYNYNLASSETIKMVLDKI